jgi:hypothetical protein
MLKGPSFRFKAGRVIEIEHESGRFGYLIAHFSKPRYGNFFSLVTRTYNSSINADDLQKLLDEPKTTVWLNSYKLLTTEGAITLRHKGDLPSYPVPEPATWGGGGAVEHFKFITIWYPDGTEEVRRGSYSLTEWEDRMEQEGIFQAVLWLPKSIGAFLFDGVPLRWSAYKEY